MSGTPDSASIGDVWSDQLDVDGVGVCGERFEIRPIAGEDGAAGFGYGRAA